MKLFATALAVAALAAAQADARPVLVELFTSQACSSCPPADALLASLQQRDRDMLPLSFNVTYWNGPAWTDTDSLDAATARQSWYAGLQHSDSVYTPEAVVDGGAQLVGSDRATVTAAITAAHDADAGGIPVDLKEGAGRLTISVGQDKTAQPETIWVFGFDRLHTTRIGGGENGGASITEVNVVRSIGSVGIWSGDAVSDTVPRPKGDHIAVVLQREDGGVGGIGVE